VAATPTLARPARAAESLPAADGTRLLYEQYHDRVFGYCLYQLGTREEAEDATQTTFLWAFRGLRRGVVPRAEDSWLFTIAKNACRACQRARGRRRQREVVSDPHVLADVSAAPIRRHDDLIGLEDALARMPELQRRAILLREWRGLSYREIAAELDLSGAAVETLIFRARRSLAELLNGKPAPKRARRFAFDFGSIGLAVKTVLGGASGAKLAAGLAAAVVMATTVGGSIERPSPPRQITPPAAVPTSPAQHERTAQATAVTEKAQVGEKESRKRKQADDPKRPAQPPAGPQAAGPLSSAGQKADDAVGLLPLVPQAADALSLEAATDLVDDTVQDLTQTVDDTVDGVVAALP
jgi:RNA polymerase sigma factor (sigma-70 family)